MALFSYPVCTWLCQYVNMGVRKWLEKSAEKQKYKLRKTLNPLSRKAFRAVSFRQQKTNNDNLNYIVQVGNVTGFIISIEMLVKTYKGRESPVLVCFISHAIITFNISLQDHFIGRIVKPE